MTGGQLICPGIEKEFDALDVEAETIYDRMIAAVIQAFFPLSHLPLQIWDLDRKLR